MNPKFSVIIPVFNVEKYLSDCLDSVLNQTLSDTEVLCIDDCSDDSSLQILEEYSKKDKRIKIFKNIENSGASFSRNKGIKHANGEFIQFVDSDDTIDKDFLESKYNIMKSNNLDILVAGYRFSKIDGTESFSKFYNDSLCENIVPGNQLLSGLLSDGSFVWATVVSSVKRSFLKKNKITFPSTIKICEDCIYTVKALLASQKAMCVNIHGYNYIERENSLVTKSRNTAYRDSHILAMKEIFSMMEKQSYSVAFDLLKVEGLIARILENVVFSENCTKIINKEHIDFFLQNNFLFFQIPKFLDLEKFLEFKNMLSISRNIYLYGAGVYAKEIIFFLYKQGINVKKIFVTNNNSDGKCILGYEIVTFNKSLLLKDDIIVSAMKKSYFEQIEPVLKDCGCLYFNLII